MVSSTRTRTRAREILGGDPWSLASTTSSKIFPVWFSTLRGRRKKNSAWLDTSFIHNLTDQCADYKISNHSINVFEFFLTSHKMGVASGRLHTSQWEEGMGGYRLPTSQWSCDGHVRPVGRGNVKLPAREVHGACHRLHAEEVEDVLRLQLREAVGEVAVVSDIGIRSSDLRNKIILLKPSAMPLTSLTSILFAFINEVLSKNV